MEIALDKLGKIITGNTPSKKNKDYWDSKDIVFIKPNNLNIYNLKLFEKDNEYLSEKAINKARTVDANSILVTCIGIVGKVALTTSEKTAFNQQINAIVPNKNIFPKYLAYALMYCRPRLASIANAPVVPIINKKQFSNFKVNVNLNKIDQITIVKQLDVINKIIENKNEQLNKLDELIKARFVEMFGDPVLNSNDYKLIKLSNLGTLSRGKSKHRPRNDPKLLGGPYPLIQTGDITNSGIFIKKYNNTYSKLGLKQSKMWPAGTLCITIAANIAQTAILSFDACFPDSVVGFIPKADIITTTYLHYWFSFFQKILDAQASQVAQKNINLKVLSNLDVAVPPITEQDKFLSFVQQVDKSKVAVQKSLEETQTLFDSLMQKYFG